MISGLAGARLFPNTRLRLALSLLAGGASLAVRCGSRAAYWVGVSNWAGMTPLMCAAAFGKRDVARELRTHGADVRLTTSRDRAGRPSRGEGDPKPRQTQ